MHGRAYRWDIRIRRILTRAVRVAMGSVRIGGKAARWWK